MLLKKYIIIFLYKLTNKTSMSNQIIVGSMQINNGFSGQYYLPYSIGVLCTYVKKHSNKAGNLEFALPIYKR